MAYTYDKNTDYSALIAQAAKNKDYAAAAILEQQRNAKIAGEGMNYDQTNRYGQYLSANTGGTGAGTKPSGYQSAYTDQIESAIAELQNSKWEGWDKDKDESYGAYRKEYLREADRTTEDTMGAYAANTGGVASSAAITAASQAGDYYKSQLADKIPELYAAAYNRYLNELSQKQSNISSMISADSQASANYYNQISAAMTKWSTMGYADSEVSSILGVSVGTPTSDQSYTDWSTAFQEKQYEDALAEKAAAESGGGSGTGTGSTAGKGKLQAATNAASGSSTNLVSVPKYGNITYDDAEKLVRQGLLKVTGMDASGNPIFTPTAVKQTGTIALTR